MSETGNWNLNYSNRFFCFFWATRTSLYSRYLSSVACMSVTLQAGSCCNICERNNHAPHVEIIIHYFCPFDILTKVRSDKGAARRCEAQFYKNFRETFLSFNANFQGSLAPREIAISVISTPGSNPRCSAANADPAPSWC